MMEVVMVVVTWVVPSISASVVPWVIEAIEPRVVKPRVIPCCERIPRVVPSHIPSERMYSCIRTIEMSPPIEIVEARETFAIGIVIIVYNDVFIYRVYTHWL